MQRIIAKMSSKNQITMPADIRRHLGIEASDRVAFVIENDGRVHVEPSKASFLDYFGSIPPLPNQSSDFRREIDEAMADRADEIMARMRGEG